ITSWNVYAQSIIEIKGNVTDSETKKPLSSATVVLSPIDRPSILGYGITNNEGAYQVKFNPKHDSLQLNVSYLGYKTLEQKILAKSQELNISLEPVSETLEEVFLHRPLITHRGVTLIYDPEAFISGKYRTIQE